MRKRMALCAIWALFGLGPALAGQPQPPAPLSQKTARLEPHPAIWKVQDADTTIYLLGTTHALPKNFRWQSTALKQVVQAADELVVESLNTPDTKAKTEATIDETLNPVVENNPILGRVSAEKRPVLKRAIVRTDFPEQFYDAMPTWMASLVLAVETMAKDGKTQSNGVEAILEAQFRAAKKPVTAVEDGNAVLRALRGLPEAAQVKMLEGTLDDIGRNSGAEALAADQAWAQGDVEALGKDLTPDALGPDLYRVLILNRNEAWAQWLTRRLEKPGTILFAVGAGHFSGPDSVQKLLKTKGLKIDRLF